MSLFGTRSLNIVLTGDNVITTLRAHHVCHCEAGPADWGNPAEILDGLLRRCAPRNDNEDKKTT
jgi:hypothetical protein